MNSGGFLPPEPGGHGPALTPPPPAAAPSPQPAWQQPGWGHAPGEPDNGPAVTGFVFSISSLGLLVLTVSFSTIVSLGLGIAGIVMSRKGKRLVQDGHTRKHKDLAMAGFVIGIVSTVLAALATLFWIALVVYDAVDDGARQGFGDGLDESNGDPAFLRLATASVRLLGVTLS
ncbi:MAG: hypothetical protein ACR2J6_04820 [Thermoleophilaceae bacterium]